MKPFKIWCETEEIYDKVIAKMESEGILWKFGKKPTENPECKSLIPFALYVDDDGLSYSKKLFLFNNDDYPEITPEEYLEDKKETIAKPFKFQCKTKEIKDKVLSKMESEGILFGGEIKPTKAFLLDSLWLYVDENSILYWTYNDDIRKYTKITPEEYLGENKTGGTEMNPFTIWCETEEIRDKVLAKMESEGILWVGNTKPTNSPPLAPLWLCVNDKVLTYMPKDCSIDISFREITSEEYLKEEKESKTEMKPFKIWCETNEIRDKVLEKMENDDILWVGGILPTAYRDIDAPLALYVDDKGKLTYDTSVLYFRGLPYTEITPEEYLNENKGGTEMKKSDLRTGYIATTRGGTEVVVYLNVDTSYNVATNVLVSKNGSFWANLDGYNEDLTDKISKRYDIMKVEKPSHPVCLSNIEAFKSERRLLWERKEPKEMTMEELEKLLGYPVKIVK